MMRKKWKYFLISAALLAIIFVSIERYDNYIGQKFYQESTQGLLATYEQLDKTFMMFAQRNWNALEDWLWLPSSSFRLVIRSSRVRPSPHSSCKAICPHQQVSCTTLSWVRSISAERLIFVFMVTSPFFIFPARPVPAPTTQAPAPGDLKHMYTLGAVHLTAPRSLPSWRSGRPASRSPCGKER